MKWQKITKDQAYSSMDEIRALAHSHEEGVVVVVGQQKSGRGRHGRQWLSPLGGLYFSVLLKPDWASKDISKLTLMAAVAVCQAVEEVTGLHVWIKWPNDIFVGSEKIAGILTESAVIGQSVEYVIVGIGVNINTRCADLPEGAASVQSITGQEYDSDVFLDHILDHFGYLYEKDMVKGFEATLSTWRRLCGIFGQRVAVDQANGQVQGVAVDVADDGGLLIRTDDGRMVKVVSGDVTRLRVNTP